MRWGAAVAWLAGAAWLLAADADTSQYIRYRIQAARAKSREYQAAVDAIKKEASRRPEREQNSVCDAEGNCAGSGLRIHLLSSPAALTFCRDCDPREQGSFATIWAAAHGPPSFDIEAELVYSVPNDASEPLVNPVRGAAVLVERGGAPIITKVIHAQEAGAVAVIVIDTPGDCSEAFECGRLGSSSGGTGFAAADPASRWQHVIIPVALVTRGTAQRLVLQMDATEMHIEGMGSQLVTQ
ncbi:hypothetical protein FNF31_06359 [Cafeteria roenbergensis]|uniref:PA domain-containing protein n=1 Tax=Cafeteria roenbergensis TaxID=33653 RepID=A0A5A8DWN8_CAFRO|nr:hypothetical protein FNF31_06359 [Cafeteria roenbergensis]KAA0169648.1 hypothetical protein FNF28_01925 [Cafeteria roenbergensis]